MSTNIPHCVEGKNQQDFLGKFCGPPCLCPSTAKHPRRGRKGLPAEKTGIGAQNQRSVFRGQPPQISRFTSKTGLNLRTPPTLSEDRKHSHQGREGFPAEKTGIGAQNQRPVSRGQPPEISRFESKTGKILRAPPLVSEDRKTPTPGAQGFPT